MKLKFAPADLMNSIAKLIKDENLCQTLGQFTSVHFPDLKPNSYDITAFKIFKTETCKYSDHTLK